MKVRRSVRYSRTCYGNYLFNMTYGPNFTDLYFAGMISKGVEGGVMNRPSCQTAEKSEVVRVYTQKRSLSAVLLG